VKKAKYKISFCVVCMNRLHQLKQTLPQNIMNNTSYDNLEFIVLDYNSQDGMEEWVSEKMSEHIESGRLIYFKTTEPKTWSPSHSKNIAFKLATGDIICCIWADYYTGKDFATYVNAAFKQNPGIVLTPIDFPKTRKGFYPPGDVLGKVCVKKVDFERILGFDERMNKHGFEDYDFINRLEMIGIKRVLIEDLNYLQYIAHQNSDRYLLATNDLKGVYINYQTPSSSDVLFLYRDQSFEKGVLLDNFTKNADNYIYAYVPRNEHFEFSLQAPGWQTGRWTEDNDSLILFSINTKELRFICQPKSDSYLLVDTEKQSVFYHLTDKEVINDVLTFKHYISTRRMMEENLANNRAVVNQEFGKAAVYKNFHPEPIII
jgi:GT2 family glycosyltransferase